MPSGNADDITQLRQQADRWDNAIVAKRLAEIAANMADDFRQIDAAGDIEDKQSFVAGLFDPRLRIDPYCALAPKQRVPGLVDPKLRIDPYLVEDFEVRLYGDTALASGRTRMTGHYDGKFFSSHYRYIDVYVRRGGLWKIVSVQITKMPR